MQLVTMGTEMLALYYHILCNDKDCYVGTGRTANLHLYGRWTEQTYHICTFEISAHTYQTTVCHDL
jgi:hypothetical protein